MPLGVLQRREYVQLLGQFHNGVLLFPGSVTDVFWIPNVTETYPCTCGAKNEKEESYRIFEYRKMGARVLNLIRI